MTTTTLYQATVPVVRRALVNLDSCLAKGAAHFAAEGVAEAEWLSASLAPDMFSLTRQVQTAGDAAKGLVARLSGGTAPRMRDDETSVDELRARIAKTIAYIDSVPASAIDGREDAEIIVTFPHLSIRSTGADYACDFGLPNFFFHTTAAYAIMRHLGAPLGKNDFLGPLDITYTA